MNQKVWPVQVSERWMIRSDVEIVIHPRRICTGPCPFHNPSQHHMSGWPMLWRAEWGLMERLCPDCRCGHPDPDSVAYLVGIGIRSGWIHGCCGACDPERGCSEKAYVVSEECV